MSPFFFLLTLKSRSQQLVLDKSISELDLERNGSFQSLEVITDQCKSAGISMINSFTDDKISLKKKRRRKI